MCITCSWTTTTTTRIIMISALTTCPRLSPPAVSLDSLSAQQLTAVKKQLDEEVDHLTTSFAQLQAAQIKFKDCLRCVKTQSTTPGEYLMSG